MGDGWMPGDEVENRGSKRRQRSHRSCRGFLRSSSLSSGVYLRERSLSLSLSLSLARARARQGSDLSSIRNRQDVRIHRYFRTGYRSWRLSFSGVKNLGPCHTADNTFFTYLYVRVAWHKPLYKYRYPAKHAAAVYRRRVGRSLMLKDLRLIATKRATVYCLKYLSVGLIINGIISGIKIY